MSSDNIEKLKKKEYGNYSRLMYELGNAYYFLYANKVLGRQFADRYFQAAKDSTALSDREKKRADALHRIARYSQSLKLADTDEREPVDFNHFWSDLNEMVGGEYDLNTDRLMAIKVYEVFYQYIWLYRNDFREAGVSNKELLSKLEKTRDEILAIQKLEETSKMLPAAIDIENDRRNLDYNISQLTKIISSVEADENIDRDTIYFGYELGSYIRSVLDYDDEHSIERIVSDIEILVKDRYKITECQVLVFNGLDEQKVLEEGRDYSFELTDKSAYINEEGANGFQYTVSIHPEIFAEEGTYTVIVAAKDSLADKKYGDNAALISNREVPENNIVLKANNIKFTVDSSAPELTVAGAVNGKRYTSRKTLDIEYADISGISSIDIEVTDGTNVISKKNYTSDDLKTEGKKSGRIPYKITEYKNYQNIKVTAADVSGNRNTYEMRILVTSSRLNSWMNHRPVMIGIVVGAVVLMIALVLTIRRLHRR